MRKERLLFNILGIMVFVKCLTGVLQQIPIAMLNYEHSTFLKYFEMFVVPIVPEYIFLVISIILLIKNIKQILVPLLIFYSYNISHHYAMVYSNINTGGFLPVSSIISGINSILATLLLYYLCINKFDDGIIYIRSKLSRLNNKINKS